VVTSVVPIMTTPPLEGTPPPLTIPTVTQRTAMPKPDNELIPKRLRAHQEEQQCTVQANAERRAA
jgi:hypothetical protein